MELICYRDDMTLFVPWIMLLFWVWGLWSCAIEKTFWERERWEGKM